MQQAALDFFRSDRWLNPLVEQIELPTLEPTRDVYRELIESIISQQLSVASAKTITTRFYGLFRGKLPIPSRLAKQETEFLRSAGLSGQKAAYIQNVAAFFAEKIHAQVDWTAMADEEIMERLTRIKGVGKWTSEMVLIFTLGRPDVFPVDDLGIRQAMSRLLDVDPLDRAFLQQITEVSQTWAPYRSYASRLLWKWKDNG